jgi:hypothetical protein
MSRKIKEIDSITDKTQKSYKIFFLHSSSDHYYLIQYDYEISLKDECFFQIIPVYHSVFASLREILWILLIRFAVKINRQKRHEIPKNREFEKITSGRVCH